MQLYWWFLFPAILLAAFSDKIDTAVKAEKISKKHCWFFCAGVTLACIIAMIAPLFGR